MWPRPPDFAANVYVVGGRVGRSRLHTMIPSWLSGRHVIAVVSVDKSVEIQTQNGAAAAAGVSVSAEQ